MSDNLNPTLQHSDLIIYKSDTLWAGLQRMTQNRLGVLFVCDRDEHLIGTLSDGDVRRSLLENVLLISPVENVMNTDPISASTISEAKDLLDRLNIVAVPVISRDGSIREIVVENQESVVILSNRINRADSTQVVKTGALAIIPARGGSKRIPKKNLASVGGKSLLAWAVQAAKNARFVSHVLVSTDDSEIAEAARAMEADVPWLRPEPLCSDTTPTLDVLLHALNWAASNITPAPEMAVLLEPTAPLRRAEQVDEALSLLLNSDADCVATVSELPHVFHPEESLVVKKNGVLRPYLPARTMDSRRLRNDQPSVFILNGLAYAFRVRTVLSERCLFGRKTIPMITRWEDYVDIDTLEDLELANFKIGRSFSQA